MFEHDWAADPGIEKKMLVDLNDHVLTEAQAAAALEPTRWQAPTQSIHNAQKEVETIGAMRVQMTKAITAMIDSKTFTAAQLFWVCRCAMVAALDSETLIMQSNFFDPAGLRDAGLVTAVAQTRQTCTISKISSSRRSDRTIRRCLNFISKQLLARACSDGRDR